MGRVLAVLVVALVMPASARAALVADGAPPPSLVVAPVRPPLPDGSDVRSALARARLTEAITGADARRWRADVLRARSVLRRLHGARRYELGAVLGALNGLALTGRLTAGRMPLAFLTLERNVTEWHARPFPAAGTRMTFGRDPAVFQYFPGRGVQFHGLATAGVANALAKPCQAAAAVRTAELAELAAQRRAGAVGPLAVVSLRRDGCRPGRLRRTLDRLVALSSRRGDFTAWEYQFSFGGGTPPWISAMTQATAAQALARGADALGDERYRATALSALGAFAAPPPLGVAVGHEYLMYSFNPGLHVLNGYLQSLIGLHDVAQLTGSSRASRLFAAGERTARTEVGAFDTGAWSRYSLAGRESSLSYHRLLTGFLGGLCDRTARATYCDAARRFTRYEHEPPRIVIRAPRRVTQNRAATYTVWVSKVSTVAVNGTTITVPRGRFPVTWIPRRHGTAALRVSAVGPEGLRGTAVRRVSVRTDPRIVARRRAARAGRRSRARPPGGPPPAPRRGPRHRHARSS